MHVSLPSSGSELEQFLADSRSDGADELSFVRFADGRVVCRASGRPTMRLIERLAAEGTSDGELARLEALWPLFQPARVGYWLERGSSCRRGWHLAGEIPCERARGAAYQSWPNQRLGIFCARHNLGWCSQISRATDEEGELRLRFDLPDDEAFPMALDGFATLCAEPPPRPLWTHLEGRQLGLEVSLAADDVAVRLRVAEPTPLVVECAFLALGRRAPTPPAMGTPIALWVEPLGFRLAVEYSVRR